MTLFRTPFVVGAAAAALLLGACATPSPVKTGATAPAAPAPTVAATAAAPAAAGESKVASVELPATRGAADAAASKARPYVYFDFDSAVIRDEFSASIDAHARQLLAAPEKRLRIEGHSDSSSDEAMSQRASLEWATQAAALLTELGVEPHRLQPVGVGDAQPIESNRTDEGRAANRRLELHIELSVER